MLFVFVLGIAALTWAIFLVTDLVTAPARAQKLSVRRAATYGRVRLANRPGQESFKERVAEPLKERLASLALKLNPKASVESVSAKLLAAGLARRISPGSFLALKTGGAAGGALLGLLVGAGIGGPIGAALFAVGGAAGGFQVPDVFVSGQATRRRERVRVDLPDALDLLAVSVEAGLGFDAAIGKLTDHMSGPLAEEFGLMLGEMRVGESRVDALRKMSERVDAPELSAFVRAVIQADQLGMSLGRILRVQAADARLRRQAAAEEKAMKAPIKMLFPLALFIFPALFVVILGPAILNIMEVL
jgi:tight adherence protein C